ncbi:zinc finger BED domain-containing protein RICESLEEPER 2 [Tanacetum coccineum]
MGRCLIRKLLCMVRSSMMKTFTTSDPLKSNSQLYMFGEILDIDKHLREWQENDSFMGMISKMRPKYDKYWGDYKKINHYMYFAIILDPIMKSEIIGYGFKHLIDNGCIPMEVDEESEETPIQFLTNDELSDKLVKKVEKDMRVLFAMYKEKYGLNVSNKVRNKLSGGEDELTKYLKESRLELEDDEDFDILNWWKLNSPRFPIVSRMAKDILSIQVSTVASESAFSASGRILDPYRNALAPNIVEALIKNGIQSAEQSVKNFFFGPKQGIQVAKKPTPDATSDKHP